jgi:hypothetical protein
MINKTPQQSNSSIEAESNNKAIQGVMDVRTGGPGGAATANGFSNGGSSSNGEEYQQNKPLPSFQK